MADVATRCQSQLASFRIRELKDVLGRLGLPKQGKKQILLDKIMGLITSVEKQPLAKGSKSSKKHVVTREEAIAVIDEAYRMLRSSGADMAKQKAAKSGSSSGYRSGEPENQAVWDESKTRCPCGNTHEMGNMIQCDDPKCRVLQHMDCVVFPEKPMDGVQPELPSNFYCELCRIARGDPFCVAVGHPLLPAKLLSSTTKSEGANTLQSIEKSFTLTRADRDLLHNPCHDLQVWCVLLSDKVSFRMHWPSYADLRVNGVSVRVTNRPGQQLLGANGRDEGPGIAVYTREGLNRISMSAYDARPFCLGVRIIRRRSLPQVMDLIPSERDGELFEEAMARVRRCINGGGGQGMGADDDGDDSDLEVVAESISVNLRCPMSGSRIKVAGRFKPCLHMGCFDLDTFVELNQRARKWQCPICLKNYTLEHLIIDPFFNRITSAVKNLDEDITEVELKADGSWRPKLEGSARFGEPWRPSPGATLMNGVSEYKPIPLPVPSLVKVEEGLSSHELGSLRLGIKRTPDGVWTVNGTKRMNGGPSQLKPTYVPRISRSSSATDSNLGVDKLEHSVNQEMSEKNVFTVEDNDEVGFSSRPGDAPEGLWQNGVIDPPEGADVIVLSDTDDEGAEEAVIGSSGASVYGESDIGGNDRLRTPEASLPNDTNGDSSGLAIGLDSADVTLASSSHSLPFSPLVSSRVGMGVPDEGTSSYSGLGLQLDNNFWGGPTDNARNGLHRYFESRPEVSQHHPPVRPTPVAIAGSRFLSTSLIRNDTIQSEWTNFSQPSAPVPFVSTEGGSIDSGRSASPLREFLPAQPARVEVQSSVREPLLPEGDMDNAWFSLSLGGGESLVEPAPSYSLPTTSQELQAPTSLARGADLDSRGRASVTLGLGSNGPIPRPMDARPLGRSHFTADGLPFPVRPRSSPLHGRGIRNLSVHEGRRIHRPIPMDESDTE